MARLSDWLLVEHPLEERAAVVAEIATALVAVHESDSAYGGLTPEHIEILDSGAVDIAETARGARVTPTPYQAPELRSGAKPQPRSDIYSAGVMFYEVLGGARPEGNLPPALPVPNELADAVMPCLESDPDWRPKDLAYLAEVARKVAGVRAAPVARVAEPEIAKPVAAAPVSRRAEPQRASAGASTRSPLPAIVGIVIVVAVAAAGAWFTLGRKAGQATNTTQAPSTETATETTEPAESLTAAPVTTAPPAPVTTEAPSSTLAAEAAPPTPAPEATPTPPPTTRPAVVAAVTPLPTPPPTPVPTPTPPPIPAEPAQLSAVSPPYLRRPATSLIDVRGAGIRADHQASIAQPGGGAVPGVRITRQRFVDATTLQVLVQVDASAAFGQYVLTVSDRAGTTSNGVPIVISNSDVKIPVKK